MKKIFLLFTFITVLLCLTGCGEKKYAVVYDKTDAVADTGKKEFGNVNVIDTVKDMRTGWCLGNTLESTAGSTINSETSWGNSKTTRPMIDTIAKSGMKTIRIPVSWHNHIIDDNYTIDPEWMARVKEIVDWCIDDDMYVILNTHHDVYSGKGEFKKCSGYYLADEGFDESAAFLTNVWTQICCAFNNGYDQHLIFETLNEPRLVATDVEWVYNKDNELCIEASKNLKLLNEVVINTIRGTGGNNEKRFIMVPAYCASAWAALSDTFEMPKDDKKGKLILSVHMYSPAEFAINAGQAKTFTQKHKNELGTTFKQLNEKFVTKGYPVVIGEYGATNKDNLEDRVEWFKFFLTYSRKYGMTACLWDNNAAAPDPSGSERFGFFNRRRKVWYFPEIIQAIVDSTKE